MSSIQGYSSSNPFTMSYPSYSSSSSSSSSSDITGSSDDTTSDSSSVTSFSDLYNLHNMSTAQMRELSSKLYSEGKLDAMETCELYDSGWLPADDNGIIDGKGTNYATPGLVDTPALAYGSTIDLIGTFQGAIEGAESRGNSKAASEFESFLHKFESVAAESNSRVDATA